MAASRTARYVALYRALETVERRREPLFRDPYATRFLTPGLNRVVRAAQLPGVGSLVTRYADHRAPGARTSAIGRTKIIDDAVRASTAPQLVILGAGFDCRAHRLPELAGRAVFEVDRPETQTQKRALLGEVRDNLHYVAVDFLHDDVAERLIASGWNPTVPTCFLWEGVTNYLTAEAVEEVLAWIGHSAPGGMLIFTYIHKGLLDGTVDFPGGATMLANVQALDEPWTFGLHPDTLAEFLSRFSLSLREDLGADDYRHRTGVADTTGYAFYRLAIADIR
jgi:methyltransferase (TIGR00027 family)